MAEHGAAGALTMTPDQWLTWLPYGLLVFARCAGAVCLAPPVNWRHFPVALRLAVAAVLSVPLALALHLAAPPGFTPDYPLLLVREVAAGAALGLGLWLLVSAGLAAGHLMAPEMPPEGEEETPLATLLMLLVILFFVQLNGLPWLVNALRESYHLLPLTGGMGAVGSWRELVYWPGRYFAVMLALAAPVVLATALASLLVSGLQRCLPGLHSEHLAPAARHLAALMSLLIVAPLLGALVLGEMNRVSQAAALLLWHVAGR